MSVLAERAKRLAEWFEAIAKATDDQASGRELVAATAAGGVLLKRCYEANLLGIDADGVFEMTTDSPDVTFQEFTQGAWFKALVPHLSENANPLGLTVAKRSPGVTLLTSDDGWRSRSWHYAEVCYALADRLAESGDEVELISLTDFAAILTRTSDGKSPKPPTITSWLPFGLGECLVTCESNRKSKFLDKAKAIKWVGKNRTQYQVSNKG